MSLHSERRDLEKAEAAVCEPEQTAPPPPRGGRQRSEETRRALLRACYDELREVGFRKLTIEGVAKRAGAGKTTIYRWWPSKAALLLEATNSIEESRYPGFSGLGNPRDEIELELRQVIQYFTSEAGSAFLDLVAESRFDSDLARTLSDDFVSARRAAAREAFLRAAEAGLISHDIDIEYVMDMIWGAVYYRFLVLHDRPSHEYAADLLARIWPKQPR